MPSRTTDSVTGFGLAAVVAVGLAVPALRAQHAGPALRAQDAGPSLLPAGEAGTPLHVTGRVIGPSGPVANAALYVYQTDARGYYSGEVNDDNRKPRLKATLTTGPDGRFAFRTIMPGQYPRSGPPAHIHLEVTPPGSATQPFELVFEGDSRMTDRIRADAKAGKFYTICTPVTGAGGLKTCADAIFRVQ